MISVQNLVKTYADEGEQTTALNQISFEIKQGEFVSIMGPSGSGKSTLLHILSFMDRPTGGSYHFNGKSIDELSDQELAHVRNQEMGFIFQAFNLLGRASVYENIELPLIYSRSPQNQRRSLIEQALASVGLSEKMNVEAGKLSGGQKQRVAIARALVTNPNVIFADEPTGNLDSVSGLQVMEILERLHKEGRTVVLVTHETYTAEFGDRLIRLKDGALEYDGPITRHHRHPGENLK